MDIQRIRNRTRVSGRTAADVRAIEQRGTVARAPMLPTESAVTAFAIASGVGGALSQMLAANKLSTTDSDTVEAGVLVIPVLLSIAGAVIGAAVLPGEFDLPGKGSLIGN